MLDKSTESCCVMVGNVWLETSHIIDELNGGDPVLKLHILGAMQRNAETFGFSRKQLGLPLEDADILYIREWTKN